MPELASVARPLTTRQQQYVAFLRDFTRLHGKAPAEAEIARYFQVSAPSVHTMLVKLERLGAIAREPRKARSVRVLVPPSGISQLDRLRAPGPGRIEDDSSSRVAAVDVACAVVNELFEVMVRQELDDEDFFPVLGAVARATHGVLLAAGRGRAEAARARRTVLTHAAQSYAQLCAFSDPDERDEDEDTRRFWDLVGED